MHAQNISLHYRLIGQKLTVQTTKSGAEFLGNQKFLRPSNNLIVQITSNNKIVRKIYFKEKHAHIPLQHTFRRKIVSCYIPLSEKQKYHVKVAEHSFCARSAVFIAEARQRAHNDYENET